MKQEVDYIYILKQEVDYILNLKKYGAPYRYMSDEFARTQIELKSHRWVQKDGILEVKDSPYKAGYLYVFKSFKDLNIWILKDVAYEIDKLVKTKPIEIGSVILSEVYEHVANSHWYKTPPRFSNPPSKKKKGPGNSQGL